MSKALFFNSKILLHGILLYAVFLSSGCTKHYASNVVASPAVSAPKAADANARTLTDSLVGDWVMTDVDVPDMTAKMTAIISQAERKSYTAKVEMYQSTFKDFRVTLNKDSTYQSSFSGMADIGTWRVNRKRELEAVSKATGAVSIYEIKKREGNELVVVFDEEDISLALTFIKK